MARATTAMQSTTIATTAYTMNADILFTATRERL